MKCPECGVDVNEQTSRCHSCGAPLHEPARKPEPKYGEIKETTRRTMPFIFLIGYILLVVLISYPLYIVFENRRNSEHLKDNLDQIMDGLKDYSHEHGTFPRDPQLLIDEGFLTSFPKNPYHNRNMKPRSPSQPFTGDFTYLPLFDDRGKITGCVLVGYGPNLNGGRDIFTKGHDYFHLTSFKPEPDGHPDGVLHVLISQLGDYQV